LGNKIKKMSNDNARVRVLSGLDIEKAREEA